MQRDHSGKTKSFSDNLMRQIEERIRAELLEKGYSMFEVLSVQHDLKPTREGLPPRENNRSLVIILLPPDLYDADNRLKPDLCQNELTYRFLIRDDGSVIRSDYYVNIPTGIEGIFAKYHGKELEKRIPSYIMSTLKDICDDLEIDRELINKDILRKIR